MDYIYLNNSYINKTLIVLAVLMMLSKASLASHTSIYLVPDSIGTEIINGEIYVIHKIEKNDTYYQLGRRYKVQVKTVMDANNKKNLKLGDIVKVPTGRKEIQTVVKESTAPAVIANKPQPSVSSSNSENANVSNDHIFTQYRVGKGETLFSISQKFNTTVADIKRVNNLFTDRLKEGTLLKIPNSDLPPVEPEPLPSIELPIPVIRPQEETVARESSDFEANKYGIHEQKEKGVGIWMDNLESNGKSNLALHRSAPVGTILKITNPINKNVTYAKVVGKFAGNVETQDAIVVLSKSAATYIGVHDKRFLVELTYGIPLNFN